MCDSCNHDSFFIITVNVQTGGHRDAFPQTTGGSFFFSLKKIIFLEVFWLNFAFTEFC